VFASQPLGCRRNEMLIFTLIDSLWFSTSTF
jgi:hypothetical protein